MTLGRIRIRRAMRGQQAASWVRALQDLSWLDRATVLKDEPGSSWVRRATMNGREVVIKCRLLNTPSRRIKSLLRFGHGDKHWRGAALLAMKKIPTARPIVLASARIDGTPAELLVLDYLDGPTLLEVLDAIGRGSGPDVRSQHRIAAAAGRLVADLLVAGLANRDHKPSNLVVIGGGASPRIAVIDAVGIRGYGRLGLDGMEGEEMSAAMLIEPAGVGCPPRRALWMRALRAMLVEGVDRSARRAWVSDVRTLVETHGDPRPKIDPLRPR